MDSSFDTVMESTGAAATVREKKPSRWEAIKEDMRIIKPLIPLKITVFTYSAAVLIFVPYLTVHMVQIGITVEEVAVIYAVQPFIAFLGPPTAGIIADMLHSYKPVLMAAMFLTGLFHALLTTIDATGYTQVPLNETDMATLGWVSVDATGNNFRWTACVGQTDCVFECPLDYLRYCPESFGVCGDLNETAIVTLEISDMGKAIGGANDSFCSVPIDSMVVSNANETGSLESTCGVQCPVTLLGPVTSCPANLTRYYDHAKHLRGFWSYFILRILATATLVTSSSMLDATALCMVKKYKGELGKQRLCGIIGIAVAGFISGILIDTYTSFQGTSLTTIISDILGHKDYSIVFYVSDGLLLLTLFLVSRLDVKVERGKGSFVRNVSKLVRLVDVDFFLVVVQLLGTCWGFLESFLFIFLTEMKASSSLLGLIVTVGSVIGLPFLYISDKIVKKVGNIAILIIAFACYTVRFIGYSFITNPWLALPFEGLEAITVHLLGVVSVMFCASAAPPGVFATMNGLVLGLHYSAGHGLGTLIGGSLIAVYGTRKTFQIFGIGAAIAGIIYAILYWLLLRKMELKRLQKRSEDEAAAAEAMQLTRMLDSTEEQPQ